MPIIQPKSPEVLQAQAAAFAAEYIGYGDGRDLVRELGNTSVGMEIALDTPPSEREWQTSSREKEYVEFLRKNGGQASSPIQKRAEMITKYAEFEPAAEILLADLEERKPDNWTDHPDHIGSPGRTADGFVMQHEGKDYVMRVPRERYTGIDRLYIAGAVKVKGDKSTEEMVAISYEEGVTISELMPGKTMHEITAGEMAKIKEKHLAGFVDTLADMHEAELLMDPNPNNILYDPDNGFGVIDLLDNKSNPAFAISGTSIDCKLNDGADILLYPLERAELSQDWAEMHETYEAYIQLMMKYKAIAMAKLADDENLPVLEARLGSKIENLVYKIEYTERLLEDISKEAA